LHLHGERKKRGGDGLATATGERAGPSQDPWAEPPWSTPWSHGPWVQADRPLREASEVRLFGPAACFAEAPRPSIVALSRTAEATGRAGPPIAEHWNKPLARADSIGQSRNRYSPIFRLRDEKSHVRKQARWHCWDSSDCSKHRPQFERAF